MLYFQIPNRVELSMCIINHISVKTFLNIFIMMFTSNLDALLVLYRYRFCQAPMSSVSALYDTDAHETDQ